MICNVEYWDELHKKYPDHPPYIPEECEFYGFNERGGLDADGNKHCGQYKDKNLTAT